MTLLLFHQSLSGCKDGEYREYGPSAIYTLCRKNLTQSDNHNQVADKEQTRNNEENDFGGKNSKDRAKNNGASSKMKREYFEPYKGNEMTVVFHAVLSPHFKFEPNLGDKIYMRFGGAIFGDFQDNVVEVIHQR